LYFQQHGPVRSWVRFFHSYVFSTTSPLRFPVRFRFVFDPDPLFSTTSPVRFQKKVFFFIFTAQNRSKKELFPEPQGTLQGRPACLF